MKRTWTHDGITNEDLLCDQIIPVAIKALSILEELDNLTSGSHDKDTSKAGCEIPDIEAKIIDILTACRSFQKFADEDRKSK